MSEQNSDRYARVEEAVKAIREGEMVVVVDDEDRENEGDLILAAEKASPQQIAFMVRHTSGIVCAPMFRAHAERLSLDPMVPANDAPLQTAFTVSVDVKKGLTTGISAEERCNTLTALASPDAVAADFVRPGHVFPLIARRGGVLMRSGHTEAAVDLVRLAGLSPVGVIAELVNDDGTVMRGPQIASFAKEHDFKLVSIAELIRYRQTQEQLIEQTRTFKVSTPIGEARGFAFVTPFDKVEHFALVFGKPDFSQPVLTRFHTANIIDDVFSGGGSLSQVYEAFQASGGGVIIYLTEGAVGVPLTHQTDEDAEASDAPTKSEEARMQEWRDIGVGAQILRSLSVSRIRLLATRERHYVGLDGFGIEIVETVLLGS